jgi:nicotinate-nucleotide pyrophosphorylase (carboxylating)
MRGESFSFFTPCSYHNLAAMESLTAEEIRRSVQAALAEDIGTGDVTTLATVPENASVRAAMVAREHLVLAGFAFAEAAFAELSPAVHIEQLVRDGEHASPSRKLMWVSGSAHAILAAERVALNFVQRLSGIATLTSAYVEAVKHTTAQILDTRKTTPGWRRLEKYAVTCGGGHNHRFGLHDQILIKDNHLAALHDAKPNPIAAAVQRARARFPQHRVEIEADRLEQVAQAVEAGADIILLDNMPPALLRDAVRLVAGRAKTEASGGVSLQTVRAIAETGVDFISVGALTHSARAVDIALDFEL